MNSSTLPSGSAVKNLPASAGDVGSILPGQRSLTGYIHKELDMI